MNEFMLKTEKIRLSQRVWVLFFLEIVCVIIFFVIIFMASNNIMNGWDNLKYLYPLIFTLTFFVILNIIGLFIYSLEIKKYKKLSQKSPILLNVLRTLSVVVFILLLPGLFMIVFGKFFS